MKDRLFENDVHKKILERAGLSDEQVEKVLKESVVEAPTHNAPSSKKVKIVKRVDESKKGEGFDVEGFVRKIVKEAFEDFDQQPTTPPAGGDTTLPPPKVEESPMPPTDTPVDDGLGGEAGSGDPVQDAIQQAVSGSAEWDDSQKEAFVQGISKEFWGGTAEFEDGESMNDESGEASLPPESQGAMGTPDELEKPPIV